MRPVSEDLNAVFQLAVLSGPRVIWHDLARTTKITARRWQIRTESLPFDDADKTTKRPRTGSDIIQMTRLRCLRCCWCAVLCAANAQPGFIQPGLRRRRSPVAIGGGGGGGVVWWKREEQPPPLHTLKKRKKTDRVLMALHPLSDCTETLVRERQLVPAHLQRQRRFN